MMIDFAIGCRARGKAKPPLEAIHQAALLRFRPIMMTTMAALLGAFAVDAGQRHRIPNCAVPLAWAIVGGLIVSQVLTIFTTPVIYLMFDRLAKRVAGPKSEQRLAGDSAPP